MQRLLATLLLLFSAPSWGAITFVGSGTADGKNSNAVTPTLPAGTAANDVAIAVLVGPNAATLTCETGWTGLTQVDNERSYRICYRVLAGGDANPTFDSSVSQSFIANIAVFRGVDTASPFDMTEVSNTGNSQTMTAPDATTATNNAWVLRAFGGSRGDTTAHTAHSEGTVAFSNQTNLGYDTSVSLTYVAKATAGATGTATANQESSGQWAAWTLALKEAGGGASASFDAETYNLGDTVTVTLSGFTSGTPTSVTEQAGGDTFTASGSTSSVTFTLCALGDLVAAGSCNNTQLETSLTFQVSNGTESATDTLTINCPGTCGQMACSRPDCPRDAQDLIPAGTLITDDYLCRLISGTGFEVSDSLVIAVDGTADTVGCRTYDGTWTTEVQKSLTLPSGSATVEDDEVVELIDCGDGTFKQTCS